MPPPAKRRKAYAVEEVVYDASARQEYLTGFHKRKVQRMKHAQELAEKKARQDRVEERRKLRQERKAELEQHMLAMNSISSVVDVGTTTDEEASGGMDIEGVTWNGFDDSLAEGVDHESEYIDEDKYTTVTVEAVDVSKEGIFKAGAKDEGRQNGVEPVDGLARRNGGRAWTKEKPKATQPKKKKKKFRYETKADRKALRLKEKSGNRAKAKTRRSQ